MESLLSSVHLLYSCYAWKRVLLYKDSLFCMPLYRYTHKHSQSPISKSIN
ncbi:hypothetical protein SHANETTE_221 [Bacillus phage Shanette]|uniref:Uncharacterized protein n=1 Tax=Bacillus phage Shanette TaxID=1296656 RepID=S5MN18_9CAUD|nr:hypothetical protein AVV46_gp076 [Bacillus phage Shanette]AGR47140.1 hypothetical protein SHANETTE_221 [Bacillus phage Shanette]